MKRASYAPKIDKEVLLEAANLSAAEARFLVANYYDAQKQRKRADMQLRHLGDKEHASILTYTANVHAETEAQVKRALKKYAEGSLIGRWCMSHVGIAEVIAAGLIAYLRMEWTTKEGEKRYAATAGSFHRFADLDPTSEWKKGEKRPYCKAMKDLTFHMGECFKRTCNNPDSYYGILYAERKKQLVKKNQRGGFADAAKTHITKSADVKETLRKGQLPASRIDRQACNWAVKIFLSHLHAVMYWEKYHKPPPRPYAIQHLGHAHEIRVQNAHMFSGFEDAYYGGAFVEAAE